MLIPTNLVPSSETDIADVYRQHWSQIRTRFSRHNRLQDWYNFRLSTISPASFREQLNRIFSDQPTVFKINFAFGFILLNTDTGALQYHHTSANNNLVLEQPFLVSNREDLGRAIQEISHIDFLEWVRQQRPNSKWFADLVTNVTRGPFLERPGKLTGPVSYFEIEVSRKAGCVLTSNEVHFVSLAENFTV